MNITHIEIVYNIALKPSIIALGYLTGNKQNRPHKFAPKWCKIKENSSIKQHNIITNKQIIINDYNRLLLENRCVTFLLLGVVCLSIELRKFI